MTSAILDKLVEMRGIETQYIDAWGNPAEVSEQSRKKLLSAMEYQLEDEAALNEQVDEQIFSAWLKPLNPVQVFRQQDALNIPVRLPISQLADDLEIKVVTEQGEQHTLAIEVTDWPLAHVAEFEDTEYHEYSIALALSLPLGYHSLSLYQGKDLLGQMRLIIAPEYCYQPEAIKQGSKIWGLSVQLYCLRSKRNWGVGDFTDLSLLTEQAAKLGAHFIGLNPIHALYPADPESCSPYGPSSRRWLNFIYLDVTKLDGYQDESVQSIVNTDDFQQKLAHARAQDWVDYPLVTDLKLTALSAVFDYQNKRYLSKNSKVNKAFKAFVEQGGESLEMLAVYDALQEQLNQEGKPSWGWPVFPEALNEFHKPAVNKFKKANKDRVKFYLFLQWQAAIQLEQANAVAHQENMLIGLYRDLAVGVSEGSAEIWGNRDLYSTQASVGAPPDVLGPLGQNWGLPPMDPDKLYQQQYQPIIDLFDANMRSTGALRIDHVMALLRLWWVIKGDDPKDGGYVYYPVDDLLAILALESHRHQSLVIGEDLGTVPEEIREKLAENGVFSYRVFFFEQAEDGGFFSPAHYPEQSMSTLTTHDMPTLTGYWHCLDLELGKELGLYPDEAVLSTLYHSRHKDKQQILDSLHGHNTIPDSVPRQVEQVGMSHDLNKGMQWHMAAGSSALLSLQLEDWLQMDQPVNVPGTFKEYPNWKRKLSRNLEDIFADNDIIHLAQGISAARANASSDK